MEGIVENSANSETTRLIGDNRAHANRSRPHKLSVAQALTRLRPLLLIYFCNVGGASTIRIALTRIFEDAICRQHFDGHVEESKCKIDVIQLKLSYILAYTPAFEALLGRSWHSLE